MNMNDSVFPDFFDRGGEMGKLIRDFNWADSPLGIPEKWPASIQTSIQLCLDSLFPMVIYVGPELRIIYNDAWRPTLGSTKHPHALGQPAKKVWPEIWSTIGPMLEQVMESGEPTYEKDHLLLLDRHGYLEETYWTYSYSPLRDERGKVSGVFAVVNDSTSEVINERHLRMLRDLGHEITDVKNIDEVYDKFLNVINQYKQDFPFSLLYRLRLDGTGANLIGSTGLDLNSRHIFDTLEFAEGQLGSRNFLKCVHTKKPVMVHDLRNRMGDMPTGIWNVHPEEAILVPITLPGAERPKVIFIAGVNPHRKLTPEYASFYELAADQIAREIVRIKTFDEAKVQALKIAKIHLVNEKNIRQMADSIPQMIWVTDPDGNAYFHNERWTIYTGVNASALINDGWLQVLHAEDLPAVKSKWQEAFVHKSVFETEYRLKGSDGIYRWFLARAVPALKEDGQIEKWYGTTTDIHEKRKLEEKLIEREFILRNLVDHSPSAITILSGPDLIIEQANIKFYELINKCAEEVIGKSALEVFPAIREKGLDKILFKVLNTGIPYINNEFEVQLDRYGKEGSAFFSYLYQPLHNAAGVIDKLMVVSTDITSHVQLRKSVEESGSRLRLAIESSRMGTWDYDPVHDKLELSDRAREIFGFDTVERIDMMTLYDSILGRDRSQVISSIQYALQLDSNGKLDLEFSIAPKSEAIGKVLKLNGKTFFDKKGNAYRFVGTVLDITEQKKFSEELESRIALRTQELKVANDELIQINTKLEKSNRELESFTYIASHDLQEPLRKILFFSDLIQQKSQSLNGMENYFNKISMSTQRMSDLITALLRYSTISNSHESSVPVDLNMVIAHIREDYEIMIQEKNAIIEFDHLPIVNGKEVQLFQLFANLISNGLKFSVKNPTITVRYRLVRIHDLENIYHTNHRAFHEITVSDDGIGFEPIYSDQIFAMFQRLHGRNEYPGMGLGLALCKKIVDNHEGFIRGTGKPGEGATFTVSLPV